MNKYFKLFPVFVLSPDKYIVFHFVTRQKKVTSPQAPMRICFTDNIRLLLYASFRQLSILMFIKDKFIATVYDNVYYDSHSSNQMKT